MHPKGIEPSPSDPESNALSIKLRVQIRGVALSSTLWQKTGFLLILHLFLQF